MYKQYAITFLAFFFAHCSASLSLKVANEPGLVALADIKTNQIVASLRYWEHEKSPKGKIAFCGDLYVNKKYRNKGLLDTIHVELKKVLKSEGYVGFQCYIEPFEKREHADGSCGDYIYDTDPVIRQQKIDTIIHSYCKRGGRLATDSQGNPALMNSVVTGKECLMFNFSIID